MDRNMVTKPREKISSGRTPQGCVDRNTSSKPVRVYWMRVAPRRGAWIEISVFGSVGGAFTKVAPRRGAWIEIMRNFRNHAIPRSHPAGVRG